jgi:hypothetical protein
MDLPDVLTDDATQHAFYLPHHHIRIKDFRLQNLLATET